MRYCMYSTRWYAQNTAPLAIWELTQLLLGPFGKEEEEGFFLSFFMMRPLSLSLCYVQRQRKRGERGGTLERKETEDVGAMLRR